MFKVSRGLSLEIFNELFQFREQIPYELTQRPQFQTPWVHSVFSGAKIWAPELYYITMLSLKQKISESLSAILFTKMN